MGHYLLTGAAGFIAFRVAEMLLDEGHKVTGVDNMNDAYDVRMKEYRLSKLRDRPGFSFHQLDICDCEGLERTHELAFPDGGTFDAVINLAARAGVRQSVENPGCTWTRTSPALSTCSSLLKNTKYRSLSWHLPPAYTGRTHPFLHLKTRSSDRPLQAYAASKKGAEALCHAYHYLYGIDVTIFRYFTVYGPAGRPDMVMFRFTKWIEEGSRCMLMEMESSHADLPTWTISPGARSLG
jgi:UDP-glucuronate 4-epimerase